MNELVSIRDLTDIQGVNRHARAYAFLNATFRLTATGPSPVRDALDCLIPFIVPYTNGNAGSQIDGSKLQSFLRSTYGFDIPLYALDQIMPALQSHGHVEFKNEIKRFVAKAKNDTFAVAKEEIDTDLDDIAALMRVYAKSLGFDAEPPSGGWDLAIINFLKPNIPLSARKIHNLKSVIVDLRETERKIVASYIGKLSEEQPHRFERILRIFMGILIEEFLSSVSEVGAVDPKKSPLVIFYDTTVLLQALGCSGRVPKAATDELTRYLQDIGCEVRFLPGNESEVNNVIYTILSVKDGGGEIEGQTADAISRGEVSIADLRMLQNNFVERLAKQNIFEFSDKVPEAKALASHQINESAFAAYIQEESQKRGRNYAYHNRQNDAGYIGTVQRLRRGVAARDFANCRYLFVTTNRLLALASRSFLIKEKQLTGSQCPPALHVTQVATIAWLLKDHKIQPELAGRELLANCYAAVRPDAEWFKYFREEVEKTVGDMEEFAQSPGGAIILQATRRVAQEQSFSNASIMRELSAVEIIDHARRDYEKREDEANKRQAEELRGAVERGKAEAIQASSAAREKSIEDWSRRNARQFVTGFQVIVCVFVTIIFAADSVGWLGSGWMWVGAKIVLSVVAFLSIVDLVGFKFIRPVFSWANDAVASYERRRLAKNLTGNKLVDD